MIGQVTEIYKNGLDIQLDWYIGCYSNCVE